MVRYFRCADPSQQCQYSRTREILAEGDGVCPIANPQCASHRQPVPWWVAIPQRHPQHVWIGVGLATFIVVALLLLSFSGPGAWADQHAALSAEAADLGRRLADLEADPSATVVPRVDALAEAERLRDEAARLSAEIGRAVTAGAAEDAKRLHGQLDAVAQQIAVVTAADGSPDNHAEERSVAAAQLTRDYETLEETAETAALSEVTLRGGADGVEAYSKLTEQIRDGMRRSRLLAAPVVIGENAARMSQVQEDVRVYLETAIRQLGRLPGDRRADPQA